MKIDTRARWFRWMFKPVLFLFVAMLSVFLLTYLGGQLFQSQKAIIDVGNFLDNVFWELVILRFSLYALLYWQAETIITWALKTQSVDDISIDVSSFRSMMLRVVVFYELLFPFDLIGRLSGGGW